VAARQNRRLRASIQENTVTMTNTESITIYVTNNTGGNVLASSKSGSVTIPNQTLNFSEFMSNEDTDGLKVTAYPGNPTPTTVITPGAFPYPWKYSRRGGCSEGPQGCLAFVPSLSGSSFIADDPNTIIGPLSPPIPGTANFVGVYFAFIIPYGESKVEKPKSAGMVVHRVTRNANQSTNITEDTADVWATLRNNLIANGSGVTKFAMQSDDGNHPFPNCTWLAGIGKEITAHITIG
jgi:hypothetical protein